MEKIPTAKDYFLQKVFPKSFFESRDSVELDYKIDPSKQESVQIMVEFAKMHVEAALKEASEKARLAKAFDYGSYYEPTANFKPIDEKVVVKESYGHGDSGYEAVKIDTDSILNSYPLTKIQ